MSLREEVAQEPAVLADGRAMWTGLRRTAEVWLPLVPENLPPAGRLRGCRRALPATLRQDKEALRPSVHGALPCTVSVSRDGPLRDHGHGDMRLWAAATGETLQCGAGGDLEGPGAAVRDAAIVCTVEV